MVRKLKNENKLNEKDQAVINKFNEEIQKSLDSIQNTDKNTLLNFIKLDQINSKLKVNLMEVVNSIADKTMLESLTIASKNPNMSEEEKWVKISELVAENIVDSMREQVGLMNQFEIAKMLFQDANEVDIENPDHTTMAYEFVKKVNDEIYGLLVGALQKKIAGLKISG